MKLLSVILFLLFFALSNAKAQMSEDCQSALVSSLKLSMTLVGKEQLIRTIDEVNRRYLYRKRVERTESDTLPVSTISYSTKENENEIGPFALFSMVQGSVMEDKLSNVAEVIAVCFNKLPSGMKERYRYNFQTYYGSLTRSCF